jgi:O-antigen/teichoic acid export membrane protein
VPNQAYWDGQKVIPFLALGIIMMGIQRALFFILQIPKATKSIPLIVGVSAALNFTLNWILIPKYDFMGAAYANVSAYFFGVSLAYFIAQKHYPMQYEIKRMAMLLSIAAGLFLITLVFGNFSLIERVLYKGVIVMSFPVILYLVNFYDPVEIDRIKGSLRKWRKKVMAKFPGVR